MQESCTATEVDVDFSVPPPQFAHLPALPAWSEREIGSADDPSPVVLPTTAIDVYQSAVGDPLPAAPPRSTALPCVTFGVIESTTEFMCRDVVGVETGDGGGAVIIKEERTKDYVLALIKGCEIKDWEGRKVWGDRASWEGRAVGGELTAQATRAVHTPLFTPRTRSGQIRGQGTGRAVADQGAHDCEGDA